MADANLARRVEAVRRFTRFYTRRIGVLQEGLLQSPFSLTQARVLFELAHRDRPSASELGRELGLDAGYLSRILRNFQRRRLLKKTPSETDGRQMLLSLTQAGRDAFAPLNLRSREEVGDMLGPLSLADQRRLVDAMETIETLLGAEPEKRTPYLLRPHRPGDMGWVIGRHAALYAREFGWDETFEAMVAEVAATFIREFKPKRERCWIAERNGENVGSVLVVEASPEVAKLRLLIVEPSARGLGIGARLVDECIRFAKDTGYGTLSLWTNSILIAARRIYENAGFRLVHAEPHHSFGQDLVGETWELRL
ncbi:MAG TPA: bifunctional helix-turn-helix transcriptional regulator/GNAT family N-acetyltransferase [Candidatus Cybelea sp.]|nr:bifunctional helix-turn-helix transcriptional regulator/GNAT family N-acetyltransferase [Candidatus Cybelea sp.]